MRVSDVNFDSTVLWSVTEGSSDGPIAAWDLTSGARVVGPTGPQGTRLVAMSPDHAVVVARSSAFESRMQLLNAETGEPLGPVLAPPGATWGNGPVRFSPDGRTLVAGGSGRSVVVWDWSDYGVSERRLSYRTPLDSNGDAVAIAHGGTRIALADDTGAVRILDGNGGLVREMSLGPLEPSSPRLAFALGGELLVAQPRPSADGVAAKVWDVRTGALRALLIGLPPVDPAVDSCWVDGGLAVGPATRDSSGTAALYCEGSEVGVLLAWQLPVFGTDPSVRVVTPSLTSFGIRSRPLGVAPDGRTLVIGDPLAVVIDVRTGEVIALLPGRGALDERSISDAAFSPDGGSIAIGYESGRVGLFDIATGRQTISSSPGHPVQSNLRVAFAPDGKTLYSLGDDSARLWALPSLELIGPPLNAPAPRVQLPPVYVVCELCRAAIAVSSDGQLIAAGRELVHWTVGSDEWTRLACAVANRNLTQAEWDRFIGNAAVRRKTCPDLPLP
jgi:WD40 repeat protein